MSLSRWLRDYLYIPLGGNRHGKLMTYRNLMLTMLLGGLWHGASWHFVVWGGYHGLLLSAERVAGRHFFEQRPKLWIYPLRMLVTFVLVAVGWVFFRAEGVAEACYVIGQMFAHVAGETLLPVWTFWLIGVSFVLALLEESRGWVEGVSRRASWSYVGAVVTLLFAIELFGVTEQSIPFIYFQF